jgi:hypothetical protein
MRSTFERSICLANFSKKPFDIIDFGVCYLDDLIGELKDNKEVVIDQELGIIKLYRKGIDLSFSILFNLSNIHRTNGC